MPQNGRFCRPYERWIEALKISGLENDMMRSLKAAALVLVVTIASLVGTSAVSTAAKSIILNPEQTKSINKISDYMNSFKTLQGEFTQISPKGNVSKGVMFISKPGKLRFEYSPPNPFLLVSDGKWVTLKNRAKEKGDQFPLAATPLRLVVAPKVDLLQEANILGFEQADGITSVVLEDRKGTIGGQLVLIFDETQNQLQQWIIVDGKGRRTTVSLANLESGMNIDPKLFVVKIDRKEKDSR
ncbi:MAG TPA: outer-membrane lipoprotein carrier protein LolA [Aestuariivirga sp.]|nr:outer-membrane lipoprotein carrier protein LolA [Hyphomicrobiales bacterium]MBP9174996.1 outer-membrane lipoprotein carrier protein LolA [Hyphomicrobiales bacterium]MCC7481258.1 outer-membrane lipoprotein carrier protein LolA [Hyphomicrobiales bacterium]HQY72499.1 outer-membrane lipoprotein carrier protein LolA [Aestuariivirga sp.]HRA92749.1 outer-membrane lipoprotein carrier protein LolA [Aestuariivirga sp.]